MDRGYYKQWRKEEDSAVWQKPPIYGRLWQWIKMTADYETGILKPRSMAAIAESISWRERGNSVIPKRNHVYTMLQWMQSEGMIKLGQIQQGIHGPTEIRVENWDRYNGTGNGKNTTRNTPGIQNPDLYKGINIQRSTSSNEEVSAAVATTPPRKRKPKIPTDPLTNPKPILNLIYSDKTVVVKWAKDGKLIKELLRREKDLGELDPHKVVYERWQAFRAGAADKDFRVSGRPKDVSLFSLVYQTLVEKSPNSKRTFVCDAGHGGLKGSETGNVWCPTCNKWLLPGYFKEEK